MNYHTLFFTLLSLLFLFQLKNFKKREEIPAYIKNLRKQDEMKLKTYKFYDLSKEFTGDKKARLIQEARNKRIEKFCRNKQVDSQSLPSDPLRFTKYGGFFCCPDPDNWLTKFSDLITKNLSRLQFTFKKQTDVKINEMPSFILTEDPIQRFLKYYHYNARIQRYVGTAFLFFYSNLKSHAFKIPDRCYQMEIQDSRASRNNENFRSAQCWRVRNFFPSCYQQLGWSQRVLFVKRGRNPTLSFERIRKVSNLCDNAEISCKSWDRYWRHDISFLSVWFPSSRSREYFDRRARLSPRRTSFVNSWKACRLLCRWFYGVWLRFQSLFKIN